MTLKQPIIYELKTKELLLTRINVKANLLKNNTLFSFFLRSDFFSSLYILVVADVNV